MIKEQFQVKKGKDGLYNKLDLKTNHRGKIIFLKSYLSVNSTYTKDLNMKRDEINLIHRDENSYSIW